MPRRLANKSLNFRLPLLIAALLLIAITVFAAVAYRAATTGAIENAHLRLATVASQFSELLGQEAQNAVRQLEASVENPAIVAYARGRAGSDSAATAALRGLVRDTSAGANVEIRNSSGDLLLAALPEGAESAAIAAAAAAPRRPDSVAVGPFYRVGDFVFYEVTAPIDLAGGDTGHLIVRRRLGSSRVGVRQLVDMVGSNSSLFLGNQAGDVWADATAAAESVLVGDVPEGETYERGGTTRLAARAPIRSSPWSVAVERPRVDALDGVQSLVRKLVGAGLLVVGLGALAGWILSRRLTLPLRELTSAAEAVAGGERREFRPQHERRDEIGRLGDAFGTMVIRLTAGEEKLRSSEEQYRLLFDLNPNPMWVFDRETLGFLAVNDAAVRKYGYSREEFLSMTLRDIRPTDEIPRLLEAVGRETGDDGEPNRWRHLTRDGTVLDVEITGKPLSFNGRRAELVLAHDVTERNQLESRFRQAQKMEAIGRLAGGIAHDFNNILSAVIGYADLLVDDFPDDDSRREDAIEIREAGRRGAGLTRQLLVFSRQQVVERRVLDLNEIVSGMHNMLERIIGEDIRLEAKLAPDLASVVGDPGHLEQVIMNLAVNARDAMPGGGRLTVETAMVQLDTIHSRGSRALPAGRYVMLAVSDTGTGVPRELQGQVFEPFFTTKEPGKGTGLGLSTVYGIVQQSGGSVLLYSEPGQGATFKVYLPVAPEGAMATPAGAGSTADSAGRAERVLLVEDEVALRNVAREILTRHGYTVHAAESPEDALAWATDRPGSIDLLLTDVVMPGINGRELAERVRAVSPGTRVLFMSGYTDDAVFQRGLLQPGFEFLQKPFSAASLAQRVREALDRTGESTVQEEV